MRAAIAVHSVIARSNRCESQRDIKVEKRPTVMKKSLIMTAAASAVFVFGLGVASGQVTFRHTITGEVLNLDDSLPEGRDTEAVRQFLQTGINPYTEVKECLPKGEEAYLVACSGCHGHYAEGKVGPGLNDSYWTYPKNKTDKGLFETIFGGAQGMMGPHGSHLQLDEMLLMMAWIRHLYTGDVAESDWITDEQKKNFTPFKPDKSAEENSSASEEQKTAALDACKVSAQ